MRRSIGQSRQSFSQETADAHLDSISLGRTGYLFLRHRARLGSQAAKHRIYSGRRQVSIMSYESLQMPRNVGETRNNPVLSNRGESSQIQLNWAQLTTLCYTGGPPSRSTFMFYVFRRHLQDQFGAICRSSTREPQAVHLARSSMGWFPSDLGLVSPFRPGPAHIKFLVW